ncbi:hypothetical protein ACFOY4_42400 [Actinomadura syzygii]|uniref:Uncharacterized protein n=1 Tax=Actinomadura syzygii TaxID=1427538 RepID=A0A5D0U4G0_9ACTN|nr:hypothetical protein [Actinomadura syzygii]TYC12967.1 hypothetical protein FXF65_20790 [Actinomadura syzygii]
MLLGLAKFVAGELLDRANHGKEYHFGIRNESDEDVYVALSRAGSRNTLSGWILLKPLQTHREKRRSTDPFEFMAYARTRAGAPALQGDKEMAVWLPDEGDSSEQDLDGWSFHIANADHPSYAYVDSLHRGGPYVSTDLGRLATVKGVVLVVGDGSNSFVTVA